MIVTAVPMVPQMSEPTLVDIRRARRNGHVDELFRGPAAHLSTCVVGLNHEVVAQAGIDNDLLRRHFTDVNGGRVPHLTVFRKRGCIQRYWVLCSHPMSL